jgi:ATP-binding cassette subfamily B protein
MSDENITQTEEERPHDALGTARRLWQAAGRERWRLVVAAASAIIYVAASLGAAAYSAHVVDVLWANIQESLGKGDAFVVGFENGGREVLFYFGIWTIAWAFYSVQSLVMSSFAERLNLALRQEMAKKLGRLPLSYFDAHQPGDTISRATNDLDKVSEVLQRGLLQLIIAFVTLVGAVVLMLLSNVVLALVFCVFAAASMVVTKFAARRTLEAASERQEALGHLTEGVEEAYSGRTVIKAFGVEDASFEDIASLAERVATTSARADFLTNAISPAIRFLVRLSQVAIGLAAGALVAGGQMSVGAFQAFFQYVTQASEPLTQLSLTVNMLQGALAAAGARLCAARCPGDRARSQGFCGVAATGSGPRGLRARSLWLHARCPSHAGRLACGRAWPEGRHRWCHRCGKDHPHQPPHALLRGRRWAHHA